MDTAFQPELSLLCGDNLKSSLLDLTIGSNANHARDLFGALIRKKFDMVSTQYQDIGMLGLSFPLLSESEQPSLLFPTLSTTQQKKSTLPTLLENFHTSQDTHIQAKLAPQTSLLSTKDDTKVDVHVNEVSPRKFKLNSIPFSFTSKDDFHDIYYGSSIKTSSEQEVTRCCLLALQGFESELFQLRSNVHTRIICAGYSFQSIRKTLSIYRVYLIIRRLIEPCILSYSTSSDPMYTALREIVVDIMMIINSHIQHIQEAFDTGSMNGLGMLYTATRLYRMILWQIATIIFPPVLLSCINDEQYNDSIKLHLTISQYFYIESWDVYHHGHEGWLVMADIIESIFRLSLLSSMRVSDDIFMTMYAEGSSYPHISQQQRIADSFLQRLISSLFLQKLSTVFMNDLSKCLYHFLADLPIETSYGHLLPSASLSITSKSLFSIMNMDDSLSGRDVVMILLSTYRWSISRLQLLGSSMMKSYGDVNGTLFFPCHDDDVDDIQNIIYRANKRLKEIEQVVHDAIMRWKEPLVAAINPIPSLINAILPIDMSSNHMISSTIIPTPSASDVMTMKESTAIEDLPSPSIATSADDVVPTYYPSILPQSIYNPDPHLFALAKSSIISKYTDLMRQVDERRSALKWRKYRADMMSSSRSQLRSLYLMDMIRWKKSSNITPHDDDHHTQLIIESIVSSATDKDAMRSSHSGIRVNQAPGGNSSFRFSYDDNNNNDYDGHMRSTGIRVTQPPGGSRDKQKLASYIQQHASEHIHVIDYHIPVDIDDVKLDEIHLKSVEDNLVVMPISSVSQDIEVHDALLKVNDFPAAASMISPAIKLPTKPSALEETLVDDLHGNLVSLRSLHSGIRVNQAPGGDSGFQLHYDISEPKTNSTITHDLPQEFHSLPAHSSIRVNQAPGGDSNFQLHYDVTQPDIIQDQHQPIQHDQHPQSTKSEHSGIRVNQAPGGRSDFQLHYDDVYANDPLSDNIPDHSHDRYQLNPLLSTSNHSSIRINQAPGGDSHLQLHYDIPEPSISTDIIHDQSHEHPMSTSSTHSGIRVNQAPGGFSDFQLHYDDDYVKDPDIIHEQDTHPPHPLSTRSLHSGIRVNQAPGGNSSFRLWHQDLDPIISQTQAIDKDTDVQVDDDHINIEHDISDGDDDADEQHVIRQPIDRVYAIEVARRIYDDTMKMNSWMNIYALCNSSSSNFFAEDDIIYQQCMNLPDAIISYAKHHHILSSSHDAHDDDHRSFAKPIDYIYRSTLIEAVSIQAHIIDHATTIHAINDCHILASLDRIEDMFLISERSDCILFVADHVMNMYIADMKLYATNSSSSSGHHHMSMIWSLELLNKSLMKATASSSYSSQYHASFVYTSSTSSSSHPIAPNSIISSTSSPHAIFFAHNIDNIIINYEMMTDIQSHHIMHHSIFTSSFFTIISYTTRRLLELGQLRSLLRMIFTELRHHRIHHHHHRQHHHDLRKLYHAYDHIRSCIQSVCDYTGDRLRMLRISFKDMLANEVARHGVAGMISSIQRYCHDIAHATFSMPVHDDYMISCNDDGYCIYDDNNHHDMFDDADMMANASIYHIIRHLLGSCRMVLRCIYDRLLHEEENDGNMIANVVMKRLDATMKITTKIKACLVGAGVRAYHLQPQLKDHVEAMLMYLGVS